MGLNNINKHQYLQGLSSFKTYYVQTACELHDLNMDLVSVDNGFKKLFAKGIYARIGIEMQAFS